MNKAIRIAIAAAFGVATTLPAFADFENNGPSDKQGQAISSLSEVNPPALDGNRMSALADYRTNKFPDQMYSSTTDTKVYSSNSDGRFHLFRRGDHTSYHARADNQVYGGVSEPGSMSEPGMKAGEFNWDRYTTSSSTFGG